MELFLERALSLAFLIYGVSHAVQSRLWNELIQEIVKSRFGSYLVAMPTLCIGLLLVAGHNVWEWSVSLLTTLIGWASVLKGTSYLIFPGLFYQVAPDDDHGPRRIFAVGIAMAAIGAVMTYFAWIAPALA